MLVLRMLRIRNYWKSSWLVLRILFWLVRLGIICFSDGLMRMMMMMGLLKCCGFDGLVCRTSELTGCRATTKHAHVTTEEKDSTMDSSLGRLWSSAQPPKTDCPTDEGSWSRSEQHQQRNTIFHRLHSSSPPFPFLSLLFKTLSSPLLQGPLS